MTLLPIAAATTLPTGAPAGEATTTNGDFAALLALVAGAVPAPPGDTLSPEPATPPAEPQPDPAESTRDPATPPDAAAAVATPMPMQTAVPAGPPISAPSDPVERLTVCVPASLVAVEASPVIVEAPRPPGLPAPPSPPLPAETPAAPALPTEAPAAPALPTETPSAPPGRPPETPAALPAGTPAAPALPIPASPSPARSSAPPHEVPLTRATEMSPAHVVAKPPPSPIGVPPVELGQPPIPVERLSGEVVTPSPGGPSVTVPASGAALAASPVLVEVSPAPGAAPPDGEESSVAPENLLSARRVVEKPLPRVDVPALAPLPAAVVRTEGTLRLDGPAPTPVAPPAVPEQIVSAVVPLHGRGDGRHEVTLELRPETLGSIRVEVSVEQQTVHVSLHAAEPATGRLLAAALAELRTALADAGLRAGHLAVSPDGGSASGRRSRPEPPPAGKAQDDSTTPERVRTVRPGAAGRLDLLL